MYSSGPAECRKGNISNSFRRPFMEWKVAAFVSEHQDIGLAQCDTTKFRRCCRKSSPKDRCMFPIEILNKFLSIPLRVV
jgi:hypothetical protein